MIRRSIVSPILACLLAALAMAAGRGDTGRPATVRIVVSAAIQGELEPCG